MNVNVLFNRPTVRGFELRQGINAFAHHVCSALGLPPVTIEWSSSVPTACISEVGEITVRAVRDDAVINNATLKRYAGFIVHELLHRKFTDFTATDGATMTPYISQLHNAVEDAWIERRAIREGVLGNVEDLLRSLAVGLIGEATSVDWSDPMQYPFSLAIFCRGFCPTVPVPAALQPIYLEASRRIDSCRNSTETLAVARWVFEQMQNPQDNQNDQSQDTQSQDTQGQDDQGQDGQGGQDDQNTGPDASEPSTGDDQGLGNGTGTPQGLRAPDAGAARVPDLYGRARKVEPTATVNDELASNGTFSSTFISATDHLGRHRHNVQMNVSARLRHEVRRLFENSATTQFTPNRQSGNLNVRALHKFGLSDRLFEQRKDEDGIDSAVAICLDVSGSMFNMEGRIGHAVNACAALMDALSNAQVSTALLTFGSTVCVQLPFAERHRNVSSILARLAPQGSTEDFACLKHAHDLLRRRTESRKVAFVLTDGLGEEAAVWEQCAAGLAHGIVTIGIGIHHDISQAYPRSVMVKNAADLGAVAFGQIKRAA